MTHAAPKDTGVGTTSFLLKKTSLGGFIPTEALSFPAVPRLPNHALYMMTPSGSSSVADREANGDILNLCSWLVLASSVTPDGIGHSHYIGLIPNHLLSFLSRYPTIRRNWKHLPKVPYTIGAETSYVVFSEIYNLEGCLSYLSGPQNRAKFTTILDISPRAQACAVISPIPANRLPNSIKVLLDGQPSELWRCEDMQLFEVAPYRNRTTLRLDGEKRGHAEKHKYRKRTPLRQAFKLAERLIETKKETLPAYVFAVSGYI